MMHGTMSLKILWVILCFITYEHVYVCRYLQPKYQYSRRNGV